MSRQTYMEEQIPTSVEEPIYLDARQIARGLGRHLTEGYFGKVTGAGGVGGALLNVPFEPAYIECWGITELTLWKSYLTSDGAVHMKIVDSGAGATDLSANATPPVVTKVADSDWTITLPVGMAPNASVVVVTAQGVRDVAGGL